MLIAVISLSPYGMKALKRKDLESKEKIGDWILKYLKKDKDAKQISEDYFQNWAELGMLEDFSQMTYGVSSPTKNIVPFFMLTISSLLLDLKSKVQAEWEERLHNLYISDLQHLEFVYQITKKYNFSSEYAGSVTNAALDKISDEKDKYLFVLAQFSDKIIAHQIKIIELYFESFFKTKYKFSETNSNLISDEASENQAVSSKKNNSKDTPTTVYRGVLEKPIIFPNSVILAENNLDSINYSDIIYCEITLPGGMGNAGGALLYILNNNTLTTYETNVSIASDLYNIISEQIQKNGEKFNHYYGGMGNHVYINKKADLKIDRENKCFYLMTKSGELLIESSVEGVFNSVSDALEKDN